MSNPSIASTLDIADWFRKRAEDSEHQLTENKIQHLLFLAQIHFALKEGRHLMPSLFICGRSGFYDSTIRALFKVGFPLRNKEVIPASTENFLELIWQKYGSVSDSALDTFVLSLECWKHFYRPEEETIVDPLQFADSFADAIQKHPSETSRQPKILISQHGPVKVSAWHPRKLDSSKK